MPASSLGTGESSWAHASRSKYFLRNFEGRIHPHTRANYLASPLFVIAYAIAGRVDIDFEKEPLATLDDGKEVVELDTMEDEPFMCQVFLRDIWPSRSDIQAVESKYVIPRMFEVNNRHSDEAPLSTQ